MRLIQSSFKVACALVVPALLVNARPTSQKLTLHGTPDGDLSDPSRMIDYPAVEIFPTETSTAFTIRKWQVGENKTPVKAYAMKTEEEAWSDTVSLFKEDGTLLAAGYDDSVPPEMWIITVWNIGRYDKDSDPQTMGDIQCVERCESAEP